MTNGGPSDYDRRITTGAVGAFGSYLMSRAYDVAIEDTRSILDGTAASPQERELHQRLTPLTEDQKEAAAQLARQAVVSALHGLLHGLSHDEERICITFDGENVAEHSDGLHGDLFIWMRDLSAFPHDWEAQ